MLKILVLALLIPIQAHALTQLRCVEGSTSVEFQNVSGKEYVARVHRPSGSETIEYLACDISRAQDGRFTILDCAQSKWDWSHKKKGIYVQINRDGVTFVSSQYVISGMGVGLHGMIPDNVYRSVGEKMVCDAR